MFNKISLLLLIILCSFALVQTHDYQYSDNVGSFIHFTDPHYDQYYDVGSPSNCWLGSSGLGCCRFYDIPIKPHRKAKVFGDFNCDSPGILINTTFKFFKKYLDQSTLDFAFFTGDSASHHDTSQSLDQNMHAVTYVTEAFNNSFSNLLNIFPSVGNHDTYPIDQLTSPFGKYPNGSGTIVSETLSKIWAPWLGPKATKELYYGGYYSYELNHNLKIMSINSLYYDVYNLFDKLSKDPAKQWAWLVNELKISESMEQKVWIIGHIFPGSDEATKEFSTDFLNLVEKYQNTITANFWGHSHMDQFIMYRYPNGTSFGHGYIAPSLMPDHQFPGFREFIYDRSTFEILDYNQYYLNLTDLNLNGKFEYKLEYSMKAGYGMHDLSTSSYDLLSQNLIKNDTMFKLYYTRYHMLSKNKFNALEKKTLNCDVNWMNPVKHAKCML